MKISLLDIFLLLFICRLVMIVNANDQGCAPQGNAPRHIEVRLTGPAQGHIALIIVDESLNRVLATPGESTSEGPLTVYEEPSGSGPGGGAPRQRKLHISAGRFEVVPVITRVSDAALARRVLVEPTLLEIIGSDGESVLASAKVGFSTAAVRVEAVP